MKDVLLYAFALGEAPIDWTRQRIACVFPSSNFLCQSLLVRNTAVKTLTREDTQFNFCQIQPTAMLRGVVKLQAVENAAGFRGEKSFVKGGFDVSVEIVLHYSHGNGIGERVIDEI